MVPTIWPVSVWALPALFAMPKSATFVWPDVENKMFAGLISRCRMPAACAAASADSTSSRIDRTCGCGNGPRAITSASVCPDNRSMTM